MNARPTHPLLALAAIGLGASIAPLDFSVNVAFPAITAAFALPLPDIRWVVISYVVTYASLMLAFGKLGDTVGHRAVFRAGLLVSVLAFTACALASGYATLLAARALQGVATAMVLSCAPALLVAAYADAQRTHALSRYAMTAAVAGILGPLVGGTAIALMGWQGVFWFRLPVALLALALLTCVPTASAASAEKLPRPRAAAFFLQVTGLSLLLLAPALLATALPLAWPVACALAGALLVWLLARHEQGQSSGSPLLPAAALRNPVLRDINLASVVVNLVSFAIPLLVPYYLVRTAGYSVGVMGLLLAAASAGVLVGALFAPRVAHGAGRGKAAGWGAGLILLAQGLIGAWPASPVLALLLPGLLLHGVGVGLFQVAYADIVMSGLGAAHRGVAGSLTVLTRTTGVIVSAVVLSATWQALEAHYLAAGLTAPAAFHAAFRGTFWASGGAGLLMLAALAWHRNARRQA